MKKLAFLFFITLTFYVTQEADANQNYKGITVNPPLIRVNLNNESNEVPIKYKNHTNTNVTVYFTIEDFAADETGVNIKLLSKEESQNNDQSLLKYLKIDPEYITLAPQEEKEIKVTIQTLQPGGYYTAIKANITNEANIRNPVGVQGSIITLLFVRSGNLETLEYADVTEIKAYRKSYEFPQSFDVKFRNLGTVDLIPHGTINIYSLFNNNVAKGIINEDSLITLPKASRNYPTHVVNNFQTIHPGIYKAKVNIRYGDSEKTFSSNFLFLTTGIGISTAGYVYMIIMSILTAITLTITYNYIKSKKQTS